jgi:amino acid transporter
MIATFYTSLFPLHGTPSAETFFENYLAAPIVLALYLFWKVYSRDWKLYVRTSEMDVTTGIRRGSIDMAVQTKRQPAWKNALRAFF